MDIKRTLLGFKDKMQDQLNRQIKYTNEKIQALNDDVDEIKEKLHKDVPALRQELKAIKAQNFDIQNDIAQLKDLLGAIGSSGVQSREKLESVATLRDMQPAGGQISNTQYVDLKSKISNVKEDVFELKSSIDDIKELLTNPKKKKLW